MVGDIMWHGGDECYDDDDDDGVKVVLVRRWIRRDRSESPRQRPEGKRDRGVFNRLGSKGKSVSAHSKSLYHSDHSRRMDLALKRCYHEGTSSRDTEAFLESEDNRAAKVERWAMPTWCHMFNSTLTRSARVWFDDLLPESIDIYDDLKKAFLANYLQQKKCIKNPVQIHHIKHREGESTKDFMQKFRAETRHVKGAPECMRISGFMHGITNPELIKRVHNNILKLVDKMIRITTTFLWGEVTASNQARKKAPPAWKQQKMGRKQNFDRRGDFRNHQRSEQRRDKFTLLTKSPKEILALDKGKFKAGATNDNSYGKNKQQQVL
ncbi:reverse transcriptase domain-containing protein [Tanacetum coccineum]